MELPYIMLNGTVVTYEYGDGGWKDIDVIFQEFQRPLFDTRKVRKYG